MAGVKITDLTTLGTAASDDLLYIVDVSDNTESAEGTSKQIEVANIATAFGLDSGVFTCTPSGEINLAVSADNATYIRVGNIVNCAVLLGINFSAGENSGVFELSLPVATDITNTKQCFGTLQWAFAGTQSELVALTIGGNVANNTCQVGIEVVTDELTMEYCTLQFQYEVV
jgi:hypothetical protein